MPEPNSDPSILRFARFFRAYAFGLSLVTASLPLIIGYLDVVPMFASIKGYTTSFTSLAASLLVAFLFSIRRTLAQAYYPGIDRVGRDVTRWQKLRAVAWRIVPGALILCSLGSLFWYLVLVHDVVHRVAFEYALEDKTPDEQVLVREGLKGGLAGNKPVVGRLPFYRERVVRITVSQSANGTISYLDVQFPNEDSVQAVLRTVASASIPDLAKLVLSFAAAFLSAVAAFMFLGIKDYIRQVAGITEHSLMFDDRGDGSA